MACNTEDDDNEALVANESMTIHNLSPNSKYTKNLRKQTTLGNSYKRRLIDNYTSSLIEPHHKSRKTTIYNSSLICQGVVQASKNLRAKQIDNRK